VVKANKNLEVSRDQLLNQYQKHQKDVGQLNSRFEKDKKTAEEQHKKQIEEVKKQFTKSLKTKETGWHEMVKVSIIWLL